MPTLDQLKAKWFLPLTGSVNGVPQGRHPVEGGSATISPSTDGNLVTLLIDGQDYMARWDLLAHALSGSADEMYHAGWRLEPVETGGVGSGTNALDTIVGVKTAGAAPYVLASEHVFSIATNRISIATLRANGLWTACRDNRYPPAGSNHQKCALFKSTTGDMAVLGSIDISVTRWDTTAHHATNPLRPDKPTHDTGVSVRGPALADIDLCFRERWNDSTRTLGMTPPLPAQPLIATRMATGAVAGTHSVQVLRTFGITPTWSGYTWSPTGEFTVWASYLNAIKSASKYIYIEDQYFLAFDFPPRYARPAGPGRDCDIVFQLGEAMKRGVTVVVLTPANAEDWFKFIPVYQRDIGVNYLKGVRAAGAPGDFIVASLHNGPTDIYVHSKLMLVDDELMLIGSANVCQRSMTHDGEIHIAVVDGANSLARDARMAIWAEHTGRGAATLADPTAAIALFKADMLASSGHLKPYPVDPLALYPAMPGSTGPTPGHGGTIRQIVDPYAGPAALA